MNDEYDPYESAQFKSVPELTKAHSNIVKADPLSMFAQQV